MRYFLVSPTVSAVVVAGVISHILIKYASFPGIALDTGPVICFSVVPALNFIFLVVLFFSSSLLFVLDFKPTSVDERLVFPAWSHRNQQQVRKMVSLPGVAGRTWKVGLTTVCRNAEQYGCAASNRSKWRRTDVPTPTTTEYFGGSLRGY